MDPLIRSARPADASALAALKLATFRATFIDGFAIPYPPADLAAFERASYAPDVVAAELAEPRRATWVAEQDGRLLGYVQVGPCKLPHPEVRPGDGELYQLYLLGEAQGTGLGKRLLTTALDHLQTCFSGAAWLGVWSGNERAQLLYRALGFEKVGEYRFPVGTWEDEEFIFRREAAATLPPLP